MSLTRATTSASESLDATAARISARVSQASNDAASP